MKRVTYLLFCLLLGIGLVSAQTTRVTGVVTAADDGEPIIGATIQVKGTTIGSVTDFDGKFELNVPNSAQALVISYVGMETVEVAVRPTLKIVLKTSAQALDEVMVVAYGTAKKSSFTGSADLIKNEKLEARAVANVSKALEGTVAGIQATSGGGQPGADSKLIIRGFGSINADQNPLYVLDGAPYDGDISAINPADIESMSILKDASASALFGARGANGVVMITTKKGKSGAPTISLKAQWGVTSRAFPVYERINESQFMELTFEALKNSYIYGNNMSPEDAAQTALTNLMPRLGGERYNPFNIASGQLIDPNTGKINPSAQLKYHDDWFDESMNDNPVRQEYLFSVLGGNEKTNYMFSLGYLNEDGLIINTGFTRYSGRANVDSQLKDWLKAGLSSSFSMTDQQYMQEGGSGYYNIWYSSTVIAPIYPVYVRDENGNYPNNEKAFDYGPTRPSYNNMNWIAALKDDKRQRKSDNLSTRTYFEIGDKNNESLGFLKDFKLTVNLSADYRNMNRLIYLNPYEGNAATVGGSSYRSSNRLLSTTFNQLLNYNRTFNKHTLDVLAGHEYYSYLEETLIAEREKFPFAGAMELANGASIVEGTSYKNEYKIESVFSRINYDFDNKYYLSGSFRTDGSSRFYKDSRWGEFWSVGGAWRISQEEFMKDLPWLTNLTLKASYGVQGNDKILNTDLEADFYAWQGLYDMTFPNSNMSGAFVSSLENKDLKWEKNKNLNTGIEANLFNSRLIFSLDFFIKNTTDLLLLRPLPTSTGFNGYYDNIGDMRNTGFDISVSGDIVRNEHFVWNSSLLVSTYKNKITNLNDTDGSDQIVLGRTILKVGKPIHSFYLPKTAGVNSETGLMEYWIPGENEGEKVKTSSYATANANGREILDSRIPKFMGSFSNSFRYRDFDLSMMLTYSVGGKVYDGTYANLMSMRNLGSSWSIDMLERWQKPGDVAKYPRLQSGRNDQIDDTYLLDASYASLKNVNIGYTLPRSITSKVGIQSLRIFGSGDNLYLLSSKKGMDPQFNFTGTQDYTYAPIRTISLGLDLKF